MNKSCVLDVSNAIIDICNKENIRVSNLKLQKLLYYAWIEYYKKNKVALFDQKFVAWPLGPVVRESYINYNGFGAGDLTAEQCNLECNLYCEIKEGISALLNLSARKLVDMTHEKGKPWDIIYNIEGGRNSEIEFELIIDKEC